jgi:putative hydrolase of the HAD superfamily
MLRCHLLIDADDTLWENNIYFEQAIETFITFLNHSRLTQAEVRATLNEVERGMGYGSASFTRSLVETYRRLAEVDIQEQELENVRRFGESVRLHPMQLMPGVKPTLDYLSPRHDLLLLTKGDLEEQQLKIARSGLAPAFRQVVIVQEKDVATYQRLVRELQLDPQRTWMIGNSPRSDINPALSAGLNAVFIPHPNTWILEHEPVHPAPDGRVLTLASFADLCNHF